MLTYDTSPTLCINRFGSNFKKPTTFLVSHYAGDVSYSVESFLTKNKDRMLDDLFTLMQSSTLPLLSRSLFSSSGEVDVVSSSRSSTGAHKTQSRKFSDQLSGLMGMLAGTAPHYVRCIKPNPTKTPLAYEGAMVEEQLLYSGVFEATDIRKKGYPFRLEHKRFYLRFWLLLKNSTVGGTVGGAVAAAGAPPPPSTLSSPSSFRSACTSLISALAASSPSFAPIADCQVGQTLVLWKAPSEHPLREARKSVELTAATILQCSARKRRAAHLRGALADLREMRIRAEETRDLALATAGCEAAGGWGFSGRTRGSWSG